MGLRDRRLSEQLLMDPELTLDKAVTRIRQIKLVKKQQDLPEHSFKVSSNTANINSVLSHSKQQCPANTQCLSEKKNQNSERPQPPQTTQENGEEPLDTDDFIEGFRPGGEKPHYCAYCGSFQKVRHQRTHTGEKPHNCSDCNRSFARLDFLNHQRTHKKGGDCPYCDESFSEPGELKIHMEVHSQESPHLCPDCGKRFKMLWSLKKHQRKHTENISPREKRHHCSDRDKSFTRGYHLKRHQETHTGEKPYHCLIVTKALQERSGLKQHQHTRKRNVTTVQGVIKDFLTWQNEDHTFQYTFHTLHCSDCGKCFLNKAKFERHQKIHTGSGKIPFLCTDCGEGFTNLRQLEEHQRIHTGEKSYYCIDCGKSFAHEKTFKCHEQAQKFKLSGERPAYPCSECGNTFSRSCDVMSNLRRVHNKERPFQCSCCGKRFFQKNSLTIHMRMHTGEKPYHCSECGQSFSQINNRKRHQKRKHSRGDLIYSVEGTVT
uniref:C2H2-type domain-containing protein n=1 Tax=Hucho hucho TaxID=62062 RepID=A0A4W5M0X6_9TELE